MKLADIFTKDPWAPVIDKLIALGFTDETVEGSIDAQRSFALEGLVGSSGKVGLGFVHIIGAKPTQDDIYSYWMKLAKYGSFYEIRVISDETGYSNRWQFVGNPSTALEEFYRDVVRHNQEYTEKRRQRTATRTSVPDSFEFHNALGSNVFVHPSSLLKTFLHLVYNHLKITDIRRVTPELTYQILEAIKQSM